MLVLRTPRLTLRDAQPDDWRVFLQLASSPDVTRWQTYLPAANEVSAREWVRQAIVHNESQPRFGYNLVIDLRSPYVSGIGWIGWGVPSDKTKGDCDFGYALLPKYWSRGFMSEALSTALAFMFDTMKVTTVFGECAQANLSSARVMQKSGLSLIAEWDENGVAMQRYGRTQDR